MFKASNSRSSSLSQAKSISRKKVSPRRGLKVIRHGGHEDMEVDHELKVTDMDVDMDIDLDGNNSKLLHALLIRTDQSNV